MKALDDIPMKPKLIALFLLVGMLPLLVTAWLAANQAERALMDSAYNQLESVRQIKISQVDKYFAERKGDMGVLLETVATLRDEAFTKLTAQRETKKSAIERYLETVQN